jgi:DNA-binding Lrp family transcriptional regulator
LAERVGAPPDLSPEARALLTLVQAALPPVPRPYLALGERLGLSEEEVLACLRALKEARLIRKLGPVFEPAVLGLATELAAAEVAPEWLEAVGAAVAAYPEVTHCYAREHRLNLWYAGVASRPDWFAQASEQVRALAGVHAVWRLPTVRRFKISVQFDLADVPKPLPAALAPAEEVPVTPEWVALLQTDLPLTPSPFAEVAAAHGRREEEVLATLCAWLAAGRIRRYGALVSHLRLGITANAMTVMAVPEARLEEVGTRLAASPDVSHCYQRPSFADFPYTLYAMVHATDRARCLEIATALVRESGIEQWAALFSTKEYRKASPDYAALVAAQH